MLLIGDYLPCMTVQTTQGVKQLPEDYKGKWLILFSHPGDFTPVCTTEFVSFANNSETFKQLNTELLGLSIDQVQPHMKWIEWIKECLGVEINFPIIADPLGEVAQVLGMVQPTKPTATVRAVFFIDPESKIRLILYYPLEVGRNMEEIVRALVALQIASDNQVAMPANWPNNELIGNQVIISAPSNVEDAKKVASMYSNYDWWFAYKNLEL